MFGACGLVRFGSVRFSTGFLRVGVLVLTHTSLPPLRFGLFDSRSIISNPTQ